MEATTVHRSNQRQDFARSTTSRMRKLERETY